MEREAQIADLRNKLKEKYEGQMKRAEIMEKVTGYAESIIGFGGLIGTAIYDHFFPETRHSASELWAMAISSCIALHGMLKLSEPSKRWYTAADNLQRLEAHVW